MDSAKRKEIARMGGKARAAMPDFIEHNRRIASLGARAFHRKYRLAPVNFYDFAIVNRETGQIINTLFGSKSK